MIRFNVDATGYSDGASLGCLLRDQAGQLIAGLDGFTWGGYTMIEWLWVHGDYRHDGLGTRLVEAAEDEAVVADALSCGSTPTRSRLLASTQVSATHRSVSQRTRRSDTERCSSRSVLTGKPEPAGECHPHDRLASDMTGPPEQRLRRYADSGVLAAASTRSDEPLAACHRAGGDRGHLIAARGPPSTGQWRNSSAPGSTPSSRRRRCARRRPRSPLRIRRRMATSSLRHRGGCDARAYASPRCPSAGPLAPTSA